MFKKNEKEKFKDELIMRSSYRIGELQKIILEYMKENEKYKQVIDKIKEKVKYYRSAKYGTYDSDDILADLSYILLEEIE